MKSLLYIGSIILSITIIIVGHFYYQQKLETIAEESQALALTITPPTTTETVETETAAGEVEASLTGLVKELTVSLEDEDSLAITVFGSASIAYDEEASSSWPLLLEDQLSELVENPSLSMVTVNVDRLTSIDIINSEYVNEVIESNPTLLLFEPFILNDNGVIRIEDSLDALEIMMQQLTDALPNTTIVLVPANPLPNAGFYLTQIEALENFAAERDYLYANHWTSWPSTDNEALRNYIANGRPNKDGHALWADAMFEFLTNE
ncbi:SGNH/GDSL hydrolase family protein [Halalkalibacter akibai]|uniref:SGNH/GDSL hydrolase family protein n=1 Tax=Halalkalibacter akibai (strain ATCC 43226 / DSM 21942 / CIP 109018 / JCM 9157 / 1139) TaxID=1236973 RepID=W4QWS8_HALA3|nr:SGNH/GDSL hydrolase family protein [Halalkalibacter akibai]GAE35779.1 hypothetical protein JCM9157_2912 [Halalkalibacter akibai JCM 9157]